MTEKLKRLSFELHPELYRILKSWCVSNDTTVRELFERLAVVTLAQSRFGCHRVQEVDQAVLLNEHALR